MTDEEKKDIKEFIEQFKDWNGGAGLIVPESIAKKLKKNGITKNYTTNKPMK